jgi:hypothetical protein
VRAEPGRQHQRARDALGGALVPAGDQGVVVAEQHLAVEAVDVLAQRPQLGRDLFVGGADAAGDQRLGQPAEDAEVLPQAAGVEQVQPQRAGQRRRERAGDERLSKVVRGRPAAGRVGDDDVAAERGQDEGQLDDAAGGGEPERGRPHDLGDVDGLVVGLGPERGFPALVGVAGAAGEQFGDVEADAVGGGEQRGV